MRHSLFVATMVLAFPANASDLQISQMQLNAMGYDAGTVDGIWGRRTESAIVTFMHDQGQQFDGVFDDETEIISIAYSEFLQNVSEPLNATTGRYTRTQNHCKIAQNMRHMPEHAYSFIYSSSLFGFANLDNDGIPDLIQGYTAEPHNDTGIDWPLDYAVTLSSGKEFGTAVPNLLARKIVAQDFNNDGKDDVIFFNSGRHREPMPGFPNWILLSQEDGFTFEKLPGGAKISHGGAVGDLDRDGDVDAIVVNGQQRTVQLLINDGLGKFIEKSFYPNFPGMVYTTEIWDIDQDGYLDIAFGTGSDTGKDRSNGLFVAWGKQSRPNNPTFSRLYNYKPELIMDRVVLDFAFADFDDDGKTEMITLDTRIEEEAYQGWGINMMHFYPDRSASMKSMHDYDFGRPYTWIAWIDDCDVDYDSKPDLIALMPGDDAFHYLDTPRLYVWQNDKNWQWETPGKESRLVHSNTSDLRDFKSFCEELIYNSGDWRVNVQTWLDNAMHKNFNKFLCKRLYVRDK